MNPEIFCDRLVSNGSNFICGVPDSLLKNLINLFNQKFDNHIITANEGNAIAMVAGHYIASKQVGVVYIQNSGLGNCINPILSLTSKLYVTLLPLTSTFLSKICGFTVSILTGIGIKVVLVLLQALSSN